MPSTPGAPRLALTRLNARLRFSGDSICSHNEASKPGMAASSECADRPLRSPAVLNGTHRLLPTAGPRDAGWLRSLRPPRATPTPLPHSTFGPSRPRPDPRPVLRPLLISARSAPTLRCRAVCAAQPQHNRHPSRPPRIRTINVPLRPPRLRDDPVDGDGLHLLEQAHPDRPAFYAIRVPRCRVSPRASFPPRLTTTQLPPARSSHHLFLQGTFTPNRSPMPGVLKGGGAPSHSDAVGALMTECTGLRRSPGRRGTAGAA
jgi:hypothetical protein